MGLREAHRLSWLSTTPPRRSHGQRDFGRPALSRIAEGDRVAAALRAVLDKAGRPKNHSIMRSKGESDLGPAFFLFGAGPALCYR